MTNAVTAGQPGETVSVNLAGTGTGARVLIEVREAGSPGKVVRRELATDPPACAAGTAPPAGPAALPRRVPRARPKPQPRPEIVTDLDILRRLRDHLRS